MTHPDEKKPLTLLSFELPRAICESSDMEMARSRMDEVRAHLLILERQEAYFDLIETLAEYPSVKSFAVERGSHYNDEGYSDHVNMTVIYIDGSGKLSCARSDSDYGSLPRSADHLEGLRKHFGELPKEVFEAICEMTINCDDKRALALAIMGSEGLALHEAEAIGRAAHGAQPKGASSRI